MQQNNDVVNDNSDKFSSINVEQNLDVVNDNSDKCSSVNAVADSQPVESLSSSDDPPTWAEVVAMEEAATFTAPAPSIEPVHGRKPVPSVVSFVFLVLVFLCASVQPPVYWPTLRGRPSRLLKVLFLFMMASPSLQISSFCSVF